MQATEEIQKNKEESEPKSEEKEKSYKKIPLAQFEKKVIELAKSGITSEKIGEELRKQGIHSKEYSKKISRILKDEGLYTIPELKNIEKKLQKLEGHFQKNKQDKKAMREKSRIFSGMKKIKKYCKLE